MSGFYPAGCIGTPFDEPEPDETLPTVRDLCEWYGIEPACDLLRAFDRHGLILLSFRVQLTEANDWITPENCRKKGFSEDDPIEQFRVAGIAWDGSDWEYCEVVDARNGKQALDNAMKNFEAALEEHSLLEEEYDEEE